MPVQQIVEDPLMRHSAILVFANKQDLVSVCNGVCHASRPKPSESNTFISRGMDMPSNDVKPRTASLTGLHWRRRIVVNFCRYSTGKQFCAMCRKEHSARQRCVKRLACHR